MSFYFLFERAFILKTCFLSSSFWSLDYYLGKISGKIIKWLTESSNSQPETNNTFALSLLTIWKFFIYFCKIKFPCRCLWGWVLTNTHIGSAKCNNHWLILHQFNTNAEAKKFLMSSFNTLFRWIFGYHSDLLILLFGNMILENGRYIE